jgi:hypothetical protein
LIGLSASLLLLVNGRIAGISGITGALTFFPNLPLRVDSCEATVTLPQSADAQLPAGPVTLKLTDVNGRSFTTALAIPPRA